MKISRSVLLLFVLAATSLGADATPGKFFKLDFTIKELDAGKTINSHTYSIRAVTGSGGGSSIRTGSKVPTTANSYFEVGINIDTNHFQEADGEVSLGVIADLSSIAENPAGNADRPIIRQNKWNSTVSAKVGKPTVIFSSDDVATKRQMTVELTATPVH